MGNYLPPVDYTPPVQEEVSVTLTVHGDVRTGVTDRLATVAHDAAELSIESCS